MERELASGVEPDRLAYLTFTVAARQEAKERAAKKFGFTYAQLKWFRTLHSVAYELLGVNQQTLVTGDNGSLHEFADHYCYEFSKGIKWSEEGLPAFGFGKGDQLMAFDHFRRHRLETWEQAFKRWPNQDFKKFEVQRFCDGYEKWKASDGWVDFTDLLERGSAPLPCDVVIVDEAQDLSPLQWKAFWKFAQNAQRVYMGGDDDQAIYEWAGASPAALIDQPADVVQVLPQSYRCPERVTNLALHIIRPVKVRQPKVWKARADQGSVQTVSHVDQIDVPSTGSVLYLYRNHKYAQDVVQHLRSEGVPYLLGHAPSISKGVASAILAWEDLRKGKPIEKEALEEIFSHVSLRRVTQAWRDSARKLDGLITAQALTIRAGWKTDIFLNCPWYALFDRLKEDEFYFRKVIQKAGRQGLLTSPRVRLSTIHGAKGAEADHVVLLTEMSRLVRKGLELDEDAERRVWYVGVTRAKESLTLVGMDNPLL
jgi:DNA helicase-2/ATP-dependent DNA helicase PcrA